MNDSLCFGSVSVGGGVLYADSEGPRSDFPGASKKGKEQSCALTRLAEQETRSRPQKLSSNCYESPRN
jgi:hypothetical protein